MEDSDVKSAYRRVKEMAPKPPLEEKSTPEDTWAKLPDMTVDRLRDAENSKSRKMVYADPEPITEPASIHVVPQHFDYSFDP